MEIKKLDNPCWHSLNETHAPFAMGFTGMNFYPPDYCCFGGMEATNSGTTGISAYSNLAKNFYVIGERPDFNREQVQLKQELICRQMILDNPVPTVSYPGIVPLRSIDQKKELYDLVNLVQPGYFMKKTQELGNYYGIYQGQKLVAAAGERMCMNQFVEISAVVTHPDHTGRGLAKLLVAYAANQVFKAHKTPYLHVAQTNDTAIRLYEKLGFKTRRLLSFWNFSSR